MYFVLCFIFNLRGSLHRAHRYARLLDVSYVIVFFLCNFLILCAILCFFSKTVSKLESSGQSIKANRYRRLWRLIILNVFLFLLFALVFLSEIYRRDYFPIKWKKAWLTEALLPNVLYLETLLSILYIVRPRRRTLTEIEESFGLGTHADELNLSTLPTSQWDNYSGDSSTPIIPEILWPVPPPIKRAVYPEFLLEEDRDPKAD
jgi:hypothetical protein